MSEKSSPSAEPQKAMVVTETIQSDPTSLSRVDILGIHFDVMNYDGVCQTLQSWRDSGRREYVCITNPFSVMMCRQDAEMRRATIGGGLVLPDGIGIIAAMRILGVPHQGRVTGPELMLRICDYGRSRDWRHFLLGGAVGVADQLAGRLVARFPGIQIVGTLSPPFRPLSSAEDDEIVERINATSPDVVWIGLGAPKQEKWMADHAGRIHAPALIGVGAAFDFHSGNVPWAPAWMRRSGLEWMHRFWQDPKRMWKRDVDSAAFVALVLRQRLTQGRKRPLGTVW